MFGFIFFCFYLKYLPALHAAWWHEKIMRMSTKTKNRTKVKKHCERLFWREKQNKTKTNNVWYDCTIFCRNPSMHFSNITHIILQCYTQINIYSICSYHLITSCTWLLYPAWSREHYYLPLLKQISSLFISHFCAPQIQFITFFLAAHLDCVNTNRKM